MITLTLAEYEQWLSHVVENSNRRNSKNFGMVQKIGILVNTMRDEFPPFWYALLVHMMFKNLGNLCDSFKSLKT